MAYSSAREVFEDYVPRRIAGDKDLAAGIRAVYEFRIIGEGVWTLDFSGDVGVIEERECPDAGCFIVLDGDQVGPVMDDPMTGLKLLMTGQLKIGGAYSLAEHLIKVFRPDPNEKR